MYELPNNGISIISESGRSLFLGKMTGTWLARPRLRYMYSHYRRAAAEPIVSAFGMAVMIWGPPNKSFCWEWNQSRLNIVRKLRRYGKKK